MPIPTDDPTTRKALESTLNRALRSMRTPRGLAAAYVVATFPVYLVGEWTSVYEPLGRGVIGVGLLYGLIFLFVQVLRWDIAATTDAEPDPRPTGASGESLTDVFLGYGFVGVCAALGGLYLGGWHVASTPGTSFGSDHLYAGAGLLALAAGLVVLETYETYYGVTLQEWLEARFGDDETVDFEAIETATCDKPVAVGEDDRGERVEIYLEEDSDE